MIASEHKHLVKTIDLFASGQGQRSGAWPLLGPKEPKCSEEKHGQPEEEEGIDAACLSLTLFFESFA